MRTFVVFFAVTAILVGFGQLLRTPRISLEKDPKYPIYAWAQDPAKNRDIGPFPPGTAIYHKGQKVAAVTPENKLRFTKIEQVLMVDYPLVLCWDMHERDEQRNQRYGIIDIGQLIIDNAGGKEELVYIQHKGEKANMRLTGKEAKETLIADWKKAAQERWGLQRQAYIKRQREILKKLEAEDEKRPDRADD